MGNLLLMCLRSPTSALALARTKLRSLVSRATVRTGSFKDRGMTAAITQARAVSGAGVGLVFGFWSVGQFVGWWLVIRGWWLVARGWLLVSWSISQLVN